MNHQRPRVANVGQMREQAQVIDERPALSTRAFEIEGEHRTRAFREIFFRKFVVAMFWQFRVMNRADEGM